MNNYGVMKSTLKNTAAYQQCGINHEPGYGDYSYRLTVQEGSKQASDIFWVESETDLNRALNILTRRVMT